MKIGDRVKIHPCCDEWMRGDRYGEIVGPGSAGVWRVRLDKSGRIRRFDEQDLEVV